MPRDSIGRWLGSFPDPDLGTRFGPVSLHGLFLDGAIRRVGPWPASMLAAAPDGSCQFIRETYAIGCRDDSSAIS